jgi:hypothetical protein
VGLSPRVHAALGGAIVLASLAVLHGIPGQARAPEALHHDHTKGWAYVRDPHRAPTAYERLFGDIGSLVARRPVQVRCEEFSIGTPDEPGGVVQFNGETPANYAHIRPDECTALRRFHANPRDVSAKDAEAVIVLAHESEHLAGVKNEAAAQCYAIQDLPRVAHALGASTLDAMRMARFEFTAVQPNMPPKYQSAECRPGGALDGHGAFPLASLVGA